VVASGATYFFKVWQLAHELFDCIAIKPARRMAWPGLNEVSGADQSRMFDWLNLAVYAMQEFNCARPWQSNPNWPEPLQPKQLGLFS
jgi:hypothetical protein